MHKGKEASSLTKERLLHIVPVSENDVYDFDQQDASHINSASSQSAGIAAKFRSPKNIRCDTRTSRNYVKSKMLYSANAVIEASQSGKTSTPCAAVGLKTKKKTPGTPVPWVQQSSLAAYAVSPIAVEHNSPNDLSRLNVNSMYDDTSSVMDDSAVFLPMSESDKAPTGSDGNKISLVAVDKASSDTQCVMKDISPESAGSEKYKSETDSGFPRFDSQCDFISLSAGDDAGTAKEGSKTNTDDCQDINLPTSHEMIDSGDDRNNLRAKAQVETICMLKTSSENTSADSECEMVLYKPGMLDPKKFNSSAARSSHKFFSKHYRRNCDVEPSDTSDDSDAGVSNDIKSKSSIRGKLNESVEDAMSLNHKPSRVLRTRNKEADSNSTSTLLAHRAPTMKVPRKAERKTELAEMPSDKYLHDKKLCKTADVKNADIHVKPKSRRKTTQKQNTESSSKKRKEYVQVATVAEAACVSGSKHGDTDGKCIVPSYIVQVLVVPNLYKLSYTSASACCLLYYMLTNADYMVFVKLFNEFNVAILLSPPALCRAREDHPDVQGRLGCTRLVMAPQPTSTKNGTLQSDMDIPGERDQHYLSATQEF